ncbi:potassium-transporting ATPase subunit KdpA, partial [Staphylococcus aureus]|nr:potassium-transporting ATPase subunit KdpA [Staphylococcus aureus]
ILFVAMFFIFIAILTLNMRSEYRGNPILANLGIYGPNKEGKEVRFGAGLSALFTVITSAFTTGSVNYMHDSLTPLGGLGPMVLMMLYVVFGGEGVGLMNF